MKDYLYDGSFDGLLTAIFYSYKEASPLRLFKRELYMPNLISEPVEVQTEEDKAHRVYNGILTKLSFDTLSNVYHLYLSDLEHIETLILDYLRLCFKYSDTINLAKNNDVIAKVDLYTKRVTHESHRFIGFVRFKEIHPNVFYAQIEPDHNILPLIIKHFTERFGDQYFIIHDLKREAAIVYDQKEAFLRDFSLEDGTHLLALSPEDKFENLFKSFYKAITIAERPNERQQRSFMPKRYWKHLFEVSP